jgi:ring-1,2-phenylacetyl-CoA epoxidase subunit PaaC
MSTLFTYLLRLGDDRLILGHRLSEWAGHGPILEEDIALSNIALDLLGQASNFLNLAGTVEGKGRNDDALAFWRTDVEFQNSRLVELPIGDFGFTIARQFLFDAYSVHLLDALTRSIHADLAALAARALKEDRYHLRHSAEWVVRLGDGTEESHGRVATALEECWRFTGELFIPDAVDDAMLADGVGADLSIVRERWLETVREVLSRATLELPAGDGAPPPNVGRGSHTEHLGHLLAVMQSTARAHPGATW